MAVTLRGCCDDMERREKKCATGDAGLGEDDEKLNTYDKTTPVPPQRLPLSTHAHLLEKPDRTMTHYICDSCDRASSSRLQVDQMTGCNLYL